VFQIVAVPFDAYQALPCAKSRWLLTCFSRYVDRAGKAFPSLRQLAWDARMSLASVSRYMTALERLGVFQRQRQPDGRYRYVLAEAYRPRWPGRAGRGVSAARQGVARAETTEQAEPTKQREGARARGRFAKPGISFGEIPDDRAKLEARLRSWRQSRFWLPLWGPKPTEPGCFAPPEVLQSAG
jgi:DNA-binding transcriptional MocR family regulator